MRLIAYILAPLVLLVCLAVAASYLGYVILVLFGDVLPLAKLVSKATLVLLLLSIFPLKKYLQLGWNDLGLAHRAAFFKQIGQGLLLGLLTLLPVLLALYLLDVHVWDASRNWAAGKLVGKIGVALFLAALIAAGEELLFRGLLLNALRRRMSAVVAVLVSSLYYAALHFLKSQTQIAYREITPGSGLTLLGEAFANWLNPAIFSASLALFLVGVFLAVMRLRVPDSLGLCIGCHAGWVWQIKVSKDLFNLNPEAEYLCLVSNYDGVIGPLVSVWLSSALMAYWVWVKIAKRPTVAT